MTKPKGDKKGGKTETGCQKHGKIQGDETFKIKTALTNHIYGILSVVTLDLQTAVCVPLRTHSFQTSVSFPLLGPSLSKLVPI